MTTFRTDGPWGSGKGANLTPAEVDANFYELQQAIAALGSSAPAGVGIENITVSGSQMTVHLSDETTRVLTLPKAALKYRSDWVSGRIYAVNDMFTAPGVGLYIVLTAHTSAGATFAETAAVELLLPLTAGGGGVSLPALAGQGGKVLAVNEAETGTEWIVPAAGGGSAPAAGSDPGPHKHWRLWITAAGSSPDYVTIAEIEMLAAPGGADQCSGGVVTADSEENNSVRASFAFDNGTSFWESAATPFPHWIAYNFPAPVSVGQVNIKNHTAPGYQGEIVTAFEVQWSDDGVTWTKAWAEVEPSQVSGATREFAAPWHMLVQTVTGTAHTLSAKNAGHALILSNPSPITLTVPVAAALADVPLNSEWTIMQGAAGLVTLAPADGSVIIHRRTTLKLAGQKAVAFLRKVGASEYYFYGDIAAT